VKTGAARPTEESRTRILGYPIDLLSLDETVARVMGLFDQEGCHSQFSLNALKVVEAHRSPELQGFLERATIVNADGQSLVWAGRLLGVPVPERVAGIDLFQSLLAAMEREGRSAYFLGARDEVIRAAVSRISERHPHLRVAGFHHGHFPSGEDERVAAAIGATAPDALFVGMSSPRKEEWIDAWQPLTTARFAMGVGGSFDIISGMTKRAPARVQRLGLEWAYRTVQEPRRLAGRYLRNNSAFVKLVAAELARKRKRR
jgi:N-acetylglucosaminyldiphosphoundecaprenol N-acetyl-beta-D-mannosaminyltransferase